MPIQWRQSMSVDGSSIDEDHRHLFAIMNKLEENLGENFNKSTVLGTLYNLEHYCSYHFSREETIQKEIMWDHIDDHMEKHKQLIDVVNNAITVVSRDFNESKLSSVQDNILRLIRAWIIGHIVKYDIPMRSAIRLHQQGRRPSP